MIYELINPSDAVTFEASDHRVAVAVCVLLGEGRYSLQAETGKQEDGFPNLLLADEATTMRVLSEYGFASDGEMFEFLNSDALHVAAALDSLAYCSIGERKALFAAVGSDQGALTRWNEEKRTSVTDIGARAAAWAKRLRKVKQEATQ